METYLSQLFISHTAIRGRFYALQLVVDQLTLTKFRAKAGIAEDAFFSLGSAATEVDSYLILGVFH